jgi:hypothetical protein
MFRCFRWRFALHHIHILTAASGGNAGHHALAGSAIPLFTLIKKFLHSSWAVPAITGTVLIIYLLCAGQVYDYDSLYYAHQIEDNHILIHAYHLLQNPLLYIFWKIVALVNPAARLLSAGMLLSALAMALSVGYCFSLLRRLTGSVYTALGAALAWGGSYIGWHYGTQLETVALTSLAFLLGLGLSLRIAIAGGGMKVRWWTGIYAAILPLVHLSLLIYLPLLWVLQLWKRDGTPFYRAVLPLLIPLLLIPACYFLVPTLAGNPDTGNFLNPLAGQYGGNALWNFPTTLQTWASGFAYPLSPDFNGPGWLPIASAVFLGLWLSVVIILWIFDMKPALGRAFLLLLALVPALLFFTWWEAEAVDFAAIPVLLIIVCAALTPSAAARRQMSAALLAAGITLPLLNLSTVLDAADPANDTFRAITDEARNHIQKDDWVLVDPEMIELEFKYLDGFADVYVIMSYDGEPADWLDGFVWGDVLEAAQNGTRIWVQGEVLDANPVLFALQGDEEQQQVMERTLAKFSAYCVPGFTTTNRAGRTISFYLFQPPTPEMGRLYQWLMQKEALYNQSE